MKTGACASPTTRRQQPKVFRNLALFVLQTAQQICHLPM